MMSSEKVVDNNCIGVFLDDLMNCLEFVVVDLINVGDYQMHSTACPCLYLPRVQLDVDM